MWNVVKLDELQLIIRHIMEIYNRVDEIDEWRGYNFIISETNAIYRSIIQSRMVVISCLMSISYSAFYKYPFHVKRKIIAKQNVIMPPYWNPMKSNV